MRQVAVLKAAMCAASIVHKCSDFPVQHNGMEVSTLNVYCGMAFGTVVGAHVGATDKNVDRVEYLILGETIQQIAEALKIAQQGEVVASPEALEQMKSFMVAKDKDKEDDHYYYYQNDKTPSPRVIARKSQTMFQCQNPSLLETLFQTTTRTQNSNTACDDIIVRCRPLSTSSLVLLQKYMSQYVHPVVVGEEFVTELCPTDRHDQEKIHRSKAELREVFTVFIHPEIEEKNIDLTNKEDAASHNTIKILNEIMLIVSCEVKNFKGQLRQFIVDDKGLVIIANFGLRGSTFPFMIDERAMPCISNIKQLLKTELGVECKIGATIGKAYCGVVGGHYRHEYAILGPSVNLAARLTGNKDNPGILVDEAVKSKVCSRPFKSLPPIMAKGYTELVKIYTPEKMSRSWKKQNTTFAGQVFVGRKEELLHISSLAEAIVARRDHGGDKSSSELVLISGHYGHGKSCLLANSVEQISNSFSDWQKNNNNNKKNKKKNCFISRHIFCEEDAFHPYSAVCPIFLDLLRHEEEEEEKTCDYNPFNKSDASSSPQKDTTSERTYNEAKLHASLVKICMECCVPLNCVEIFSELLFTTKLSDIEKWSQQNKKMHDWISVGQYFVKVFLYLTERLDLVLLALDDISGMDEMSWKILEDLYNNAKNVLIIGACRNPGDMNIHAEFWEQLENDNCFNVVGGRFCHLRLGPLDEDDIHELQRKLLGTDDSQIDEKIFQTTYLQSGGNPFVATEILNKLYKSKGESCSMVSKELGILEEMLLNRLDSLSPTARLHLRFGAIVGLSFELNDLMKVLQRYHKLKDEEKDCFYELVRDTMTEAAEQGILHVDDGDRFTFTHRFWMENISKLTLDSWKDDITSLLTPTSEKQKLSPCIMKNLLDIKHPF